MFPCDVCTGESEVVTKNQNKLNNVSKNFEKIFLKWCYER